MSTPRDDLTSAEVARTLGIDRSTLSRWVTAGRIKPVRKLPGLRGAFLFDPDDVEKIRDAIAVLEGH